MEDGNSRANNIHVPGARPASSQEQLWIACVQDRHLDPEASIHLTREAAIEHARDYMREHVERPDKLRERDSGDRWDMTYEYESDFAFVVLAKIKGSAGNLPVLVREGQPMGDPDSDMKREEQVRKIREIRANETAHVRELKRLYAEHQRFLVKETMMKHAGYMVEKHGDEISVYRRVEVDE